MAVVIKVGETEAVSVGIGEKVYIQGDPGFSPTIEVTDITGGHRLTITDINGDKTVDVMNGAKGDKGDTGNGIEYITLNADYTLTVHYTDGTSWTSSSIRGETGPQGPQGPQGPKGDPGPGAVVDPTLTISGAAADAKAAGDAIRANAAELAQQKSAIEALDSLVDRKAGMLVDTASGAIASFAPDSTIHDLLGVSVAVEPVQAGSGDPSPDNVRPISGWSEVEIERTCVNVWDGEWEIGGIDDNTGEKITVSTQKRSKNYISVVPGSTYYMNTPGVGNAGAFAYAYDSSFGFIGRIRIGSAVHLENLAFTTPANCRYILFKIGSASYDTAQISINYPSTDHDYHAYSGNTYTITLGQTVYGGTLDVTNGTMTVDRKYFSYSSAQLFGNYGTWNKPLYYVDIPDAQTTKIKQSAKAWQPPLKCNYFKYTTGGSSDLLGNNEIRTQESNVPTRFYFRADGFADINAVNAALTSTPLQVVAYLVTPIEITLDPVTISTIAGQTNNVWADAGDVDVTYAADIKAYIDRMNQPTEDDMIANSLIASGKYFTVNNKLYLSTASIAVGAQIIPGTNCVETSLVEALNALNA